VAVSAMSSDFSGQNGYSETYLSFLSSNRQTLTEAEKCQKNEKKQKLATLAG
jgi:hypothetical protein